MAQFLIETVSKSSRIAHFTLEKMELVTPAFFIHTLAGSVPHVSAEVLDYIYPLMTSSNQELPRPPLQISIDSTITFSETVGNFGQGISKFVGLPQSPVFLTLHNPLNVLRGGYNDKFGIALWSRTGKRILSPMNYGKIVSDYKPLIFQSLSDYDVSCESSLKRMKKSTNRTLEYLKEIEKTGQHQGLFITIESAWFLINEQEASKTLTAILENLDKIQGFVITGISGSPIPQGVKINDGKIESVKVTNVNFKLLETILAKLPKDKPRYVPGPFSPQQILELISRGVDLVDSSFVTKMADDGEVFIFDLLENNIFSNKKLSKNEDLSKRNENESSEQPNLELSSSSSSLISLKEKRFHDDFSPISKECSCYTCRKHTRSYINHLYATDELLGPVLLMIHNLTAFSRLFQAVQLQIREFQNQNNDTGETFVKIRQSL